MNFLILNETGLATARRLQTELGGVIHGFDKRVKAADVRPFDDAAAALRDCFASGQPLIALCAAGIVIRHLAPVLGDKHSDAPVLALAEDGSAVLPLLGGHHGANVLARRIAKILEIAPAITTASDTAYAVSLDEPPQGWRLANPSDMKAFVAELRAGATVQIEGEADWLRAGDLPLADDGALRITICDTPLQGDGQHLVYHTQNLALGVGCERRAAADELIQLIAETLAAENLSPLSLVGIFSLDLKTDEAAVHAAAAHFDIPARFFDLAALQAQEARLANPSEVVKREVGVSGVAEAAALAAVDACGGGLLVEKRKSQRATCAMARADDIIDPTMLGRPRGHLAIVGIGPGRADWRTGAAEAALRQADIIVGYGLYLELIADLVADKDCRAYELGEEEARVAAAIELAASGENVALVSSGDAGVFAMGALAHELLDRDDTPAHWDRVSLELLPGISAMQAAALRVGAPLGHDFCAISLSDLLTPREVIVRRIVAAATADFVIAFYNPVSKRRRDLLALARDMLLRHRPEDTPVILARNLGREGEQVRALPLSELQVDDVDMLTLVMIGSSETRARMRGDGSWSIYTPRGYAAKQTALTEEV
ncbi:MAG: precorrin-3B C(17)-methyltransferase [Alphaproteobacteria bacterium]|nr:precorrin-3B C(17)-methyltransferase [Alphaproteobacteria bacterium]